MSTDDAKWEGWIVRNVRLAVALFAKAGRVEPEKLLAISLQNARQTQARYAARVKMLEEELENLHRQKGRYTLPSEIDKLIRYESHVGRQLATALHSLERLQAARAGRHVAPPAVLDVNVDVGERQALPSQTTTA